MRKRTLALWLACLLLLLTGIAGATDEDENLTVTLYPAEAYSQILAQSEPEQETVDLLGDPSWHLHSWISSDCEPGVSLGRTVPERVQIGDRIYLNYEILDEDNNLSNPADYGYDFSVKETFYNTDGSERYTYTYDNSPENWISAYYDSDSQTGLQRGNITIDGDLSCSSNLSWMLYDVKPNYTGGTYTYRAHVGSTASFQVRVSGDHLSYQWYAAPNSSDEGEPIEGATSSFYSFVATRESGSKYYYCKVSNYGNVIYTTRRSLETFAYVRFDVDGLESLTVANGEKYGNLPDPPARDGYLFAGWYTAAQNGAKIDEDTVVALDADQTLYARWESSFLLSGKCGQNASYTLTHDGVLTVSGTGAMYDYTYSSSTPWYYYQSRISQLVIERGITKIGAEAFAQLSKIASVNIPEGVTEIGDFAFESCGMESVALPDGLVKIGRRAFVNCSALTRLDFPASLAEIGAEAFSSCSALTDINMSGNVASVAFGAFQECPKLASVVLPDGFSSVPSKLFYRCDALADATIPASVGSVGENAFYGCLNLKNVFYDGTLEQWDAMSVGDGNQPLLNASVTYTRTIDSGSCGAQAEWLLSEGGTLFIFGSGPMKNYSAWLSGYSSTSDTPWYNYRDRIKTAIIGEDITNIGECAFYNCHNLENVAIPDSVLEIGANAFYNCCYKLEEISLPASLRSVGDGAFQWCQKLKSLTLPDGMTNIPEELFYHCDALESVGIPANVSTIGDSAFRECASLKSVAIPAGVVSIGKRVFFNCHALERIDVDSGNAVYSSEDGVLFDHDKTAILQFPSSSPITDYAIPDGVTRVGYEAFRYCEQLLRVSIPDTVTTLEEGAFDVCRKLDDVVLPDAVTEIGKDAFVHCESLRWMRIPDGIRIIEDGTFYFCSSLEGIVIPSSVKLVGSGAFTSNYKLSDVYYLGSETDWNGVSVEYNPPLDAATIHYVSGAGHCGAEGDNLTWVLDRDGKLSVSGSGAMADYQTLVAYEEQDDWPFSFDKPLLYGSDEASPAPWYAQKADIRAVVLGEGVSRVGAYAFAECANLTDAAFPESLLTIGNAAFKGASSLEPLRLPRNLSKIENAAFYACDALKNVYYDGVSTEWANVALGTFNDLLKNAVTHFSQERFVVRFDANGGAVDPDFIIVKKGEAFGQLPEPVRENFYFAGWYDQTEDGNLFTEQTIVDFTQDITLYARWSPQSFDVTLDPNGEGATVTPDTLTMYAPYEGKTYGPLPKPEYDIWNAFKGWYDDPDADKGAEVTEETPLLLSMEHTLYAHWEPIGDPDKDIIVDFNYGEDGAGNTSYKMVKYGQPYGELPNAKKDGYAFDYWYRIDAEDNEIKVTEDSIVEEPNDHVLYAHYSKPEITVRFNPNGGTGKGLEKIIVVYGDPVGYLPTELSWEHHSFMGWRTEPDGGSTVKSTTIISDQQATRDAYGNWSVILYAYWLDNPTVTLYPNGGQMTERKDVEVGYGKPFGDWLNNDAPEWSGFQFRGWYTAKVGGKRVSADTTVETWMANSSGQIELYAHWRTVYQTVYFKGNNVGGAMPDEKVVENGKYYGDLAEFLPPNNGADYDFDGWYTEADSDKGEKITKYTIVDLDAAQTLYAHVKPKGKFTVKFDVNGVEATVDPASISVENGKPYGKLPAPTGTDAQFVGWYTSPLMGHGEEVTAETVAKLNADQTLYAQWIFNKEITVTFVPGEGASVSPDTLKVGVNEACDKLPVPKKEGYAFSGWYTEQGDAGELVSNGAKFKQDTTLYARWRVLQDFQPNKDGYSMGNNVAAFEYPSRGPGDDYPIPYAAFKLIFGDTVAGKVKYRSMIQGKWGGNCNGMASTAALLFAYGYLSPKDFGKDATFNLSIHDICEKLGVDEDSTVRLFIEAMQISQYTEPFSKDYKENRVDQLKLNEGGSLNALFDAVENAYQNGRGTIVAVGNSNQSSAHALLGYKTEKTDDGARIYVYDCNYPGKVCYVELTQNNKGVMTGWSYEIGGNYGVWESGSGSGCYISYIPYETIEYIWTNRGNLYNGHVMLTVNQDNLAITTGVGKYKETVAEVVDGSLRTDRDDIYDIPELSLTLTGNPDDKKPGISLYLPVDEYTLVSQDDENDEELQASLTDFNLCATVSTTAPEVTFGVEDKTLTNSVFIPDASEDDTFSVELASGYDGTLNNMVLASGTGTGTDISIQAGRWNQVLIGGANLGAFIINGDDAVQYTIEASAGEGGSVTPAGTTQLAAGSNYAFTITPDEGYKIKSVFVDEQDKGALETYEFSDIQANHTIRAVFAKGDEKDLFSGVSLDKSNGLLSFTANNAESGTVMALFYDAEKDNAYVGMSSQNIAANAGKSELTFTDAALPETCKVKLMLLKEWPSWSVLGSHEFVT